MTGWEPDSDADDWSSAIGDVADAPSESDSSAAATRTPVSPTPPSAPPEAEFETTASRLADTAVRTTALAIVLLLLLGGLRVMLGRGLGSLPGPETISAHGWMANEIEARHVRDALGRRVLVVQGRLVPQGPERAPRVHATLLDESGKPVTEGATAVLELLGPAALEPSALATRLDQGAPPWAAAASGPVSGFTVLIPDPPEDARRFRLDLSPAAGHI